MSDVRQYELVYILSPDATEQEVTDLHTQVESIVARYQGEMLKTENWGRRRMAFRIGKHREGTYVLEVFKGTGELTKELDRRLKVIDHVIRHLIVRVDEELRVAERVAGAPPGRRRSARRATGCRSGGPDARLGDDDGDSDSGDEAEVQ